MVRRWARDAMSACDALRAPVEGNADAPLVAVRARVTAELARQPISSRVPFHALDVTEPRARNPPIFASAACVEVCLEARGYATRVSSTSTIRALLGAPWKMPARGATSP